MFRISCSGRACGLAYVRAIAGGVVTARACMVIYDAIDIVSLNLVLGLTKLSLSVPHDHTVADIPIWRIDLIRGGFTPAK